LQASSSSSAQGKPTYHMDDDALQEEYIMEYVRELSLVETHGGGGDSFPANEGKKKIKTVFMRSSPI